MKKKEQGTHLYSLDFLRGIAALAVCVLHYTNGNTDYLQNNNPFKIIGSYGHLGVDVFFVISGFIIPYSMHLKSYSISAFPRFLWKRSLRIEPPYIVVALICILLNYISTLSPYYRGNPFTFDQQLVFKFLFHLGYLSEFFEFGWLNPVFWTLAIEFQYYILIGCLYSLLTSKNKVIQFATIGFLLLAFLVIPDRRLVFIHLPIFLFGILLFLEKYRHITLYQFFALFLGVLLVNIGYVAPPKIIAGILAFMFIRFVKPDFGKQAAFLGTISYSIYLLHVPIGARILNLSENFVQQESLRVILVVFVILVVIGCSYVFYRIVEKPFMEFSKKIKYRNVAFESTVVLPQAHES